MDPIEDAPRPRENRRRAFWRPLLRGIFAVLSLTLWGIAAILLTILGVGSLIPGFVLALGLVGLVVFKRKIRGTIAVVLGLCAVVILWRSLLEPSHDRDWQPPLEVLAEPAVEGDTLTIHGVRNFAWESPDEFEERWETRSYHLGRLRSVDLILVPFGYLDLMAHTMMSFDFGEEGRLILSIEARKQVGEEYHPVTGGLNQFELIYLFLDERDALGVRALQGDAFYAFPVRAKPLHLRAFLLSLCATAENLRSKPRFYHIIRHNCTTAWIEHADAISNDPVGLQTESVLNGLIAELAHRRGVIDTELDYDEAKEAFRIDDKVREAEKDEHFSETIRRGRPAGSGPSS